MTPPIDLLAVDVDGTLLDPTGKLRRASVDAVQAAVDAGVRVVLATGRGLIECRRFAEMLPLTIDDRPTPIIVAGGAIVSDLRSGRTLHRFAMPADLVQRGADILNAHGHAALVLKDPDAAGFDYLVVTGEDDHAIDPVTVWWFNELKVEARFCRTLAEDDHPEQTVRVGACTRADESEAITEAFRIEFAQSVTLHTFSAVVAPDKVRNAKAAGERAGKPFTIVEIFNNRASKWSAIEWVCNDLGLDRSRVAAIGDEINDLAMIESASLGIAMGNAAPRVKQAADVVTRTNDEDGLAHAIAMILSREWSLPG